MRPGPDEPAQTFSSVHPKIELSCEKRPHIVRHELLLICFPLLAVAEVVCRAPLIPVGQRALQRGGGGMGVREEGDNEVRGTA